jgi:asparagine synthase (glutamine-hydrolysing)
MCGICGYAGVEKDESLLRRMAGTIMHRGPDEDGFYAQARIGLGMRRLSIIDVAGGSQPIFNETRSVAIVFNGEIYNYRELLADLEQRGHRFRSRSDTETIVHLYEEHGIACLNHLRGMFAFALYDVERDDLYLARDRIGIKPLYYWQCDGKLLFGSEIKSILASEIVSRSPDPAAIHNYLTLRYVPGPGTMFCGIQKLPAGHWLCYHQGRVRVERYWSPEIKPRLYRKDCDYQERFDELLQETARLHMESDVPVGAYLSGGLDSSLVTAEVARLADKPVQTFSVGFAWEGDETVAARQVAETLGCEHHEVTCKPEDLRWLPEIIWHSDEPLGDPIVLPTFLLSRLARQHVKVVVTGEGADEVLAGYVFHRVMEATHQIRSCVGESVLRAVAPLIHRAPLGLLDRFFDYPASLGDAGRRKLAAYLQTAADDDPQAMYTLLITLFGPGERLALYQSNGPLQEPPPQTARVPASYNGNFLERALLLQYDSWLPDNILARQDKTSMAHSVEARVPFLDHVLVEFLLSVPSHLKLQILGQNKLLARRYASRHLPLKVARRKKKAFYIPVERYLNTPAYQDLVSETLNETQVRKRGYFDPAAVRALIQSAEATQEFVLIKQVLALVMLELWHQIFIDRFAWR